jgi:hypothetical protein
MSYNDPFYNGYYNPIAGYVDTTPRTSIRTDPHTGQQFLVQRTVRVVENRPQYHHQNQTQQGFNQHNSGQYGGHNGNYGQSGIPRLSPAELLNQVHNLNNGYQYPQSRSQSRQLVFL